MSPVSDHPTRTPTPAAFHLRAGALIDGHGGAPVMDAGVRVERGRITAVGRAAEFGVIDTLPVLDFRAHWVMSRSRR